MSVTREELAIWIAKHIEQYIPCGIPDIEIEWSQAPGNAHTFVLHVEKKKRRFLISVVDF